MIISIKKLNPAAQIPKRNTPTDAGYDIFSIEEVTIPRGQRVIIPTGISLSLPTGYFARICDRSGLAAKHGLHCLAGICDAGYSGEYKVVLVNLGELSVTLLAGTRVAQLIIEKCYDVEWIEVDKLSESERGENGFGSSGN
jgi:dUTP pyrophosphatase